MPVKTGNVVPCGSGEQTAGPPHGSTLHLDEPRHRGRRQPLLHHGENLHVLTAHTASAASGSAHWGLITTDPRVTGCMRAPPTFTSTFHLHPSRSPSAQASSKYSRGGNPENRDGTLSLPSSGLPAASPSLWIPQKPCLWAEHLCGPLPPPHTLLFPSAPRTLCPLHTVVPAQSARGTPHLVHTAPCTPHLCTPHPLHTTPCTPHTLCTSYPLHIAPCTSHPCTPYPVHTAPCTQHPCTPNPLHPTAPAHCPLHPTSLTPHPCIPHPLLPIPPALHTPCTPHPCTPHPLLSTLPAPHNPAYHIPCISHPLHPTPPAPHTPCTLLPHYTGLLTAPRALHPHAAWGEVLCHLLGSSFGLTDNSKPLFPVFRHTDAQPEQRPPPSALPRSPFCALPSLPTTVGNEALGANPHIAALPGLRAHEDKAPARSQQRFQPSLRPACSRS